MSAADNVSYPDRIIPRYGSNKVLVGNWKEEIALAEEKSQLYTSKYERGELFAQKKARLFENQLCPLRLSVSDDYLRYGSVVQLITANPQHLCGRKDMPRTPLVLAGLVCEIDRYQDMHDECNVSCSPHLTPCVKNAFTITSTDNVIRDGEPLLYGQCFTLSPTATENGVPLFVKAEISIPGTPVAPRGHLKLSLTSKKDGHCRWKAMFWNPRHREEAEGSPVVPRRPLVMSHVSSNQLLAVEHEFWFTSYFGHECHVSVHTYRDVHKRELVENMWIISTETRIQGPNKP